MEFGDFCWEGKGPEGAPWLVGVERKVIGDLLSCMTTNRFTDHQLPGMLATYNVSYLIVEGMCKYDLTDGVFKVYKGGVWAPAGFSQRVFRASEVLGFLNTLTIMTGVHVIRTQSDRETASTLLALYYWWTSKDFEQHRSHLQAGTKVQLLGRMSLLRRWAKELPGIGYDRSKSVEQHFKSPIAMATSTPEDWLQIPGVGKTLANKAVEAMRKEAPSG